MFTNSDASSTTTTYTSTFGTGVFTHTIGSSDTPLSFKVENLQVTNNAIQEVFFQSGGSFQAIVNNLNITSVKVFYTSVSHQPSNKKTEIAPAGFQTVLLEDSTIGAAANRYFRASPEENVTVDMKGIIHMTGSVNVADGIAFNNGSTGTPAMRFKSDGNTGFFLQSADDIGVSIAGSEKFRFTNNGQFHATNDIVAFSGTPSDKKLKTNIEDLNYGLSDVLKLQGREFDWKRNDRGHDIGVIAQEVQNIIPELVKEVEGLNGEKSYLMVSYEKLIPVLIEAVKEQQEQIDELKKKIESK